jgi:hypothetical protein
MYFLVDKAQNNLYRNFIKKSLRRFDGGGMERDDFPQRVERAFVEVVVNRAEMRGYKKGEFAAKLWPWINPNVAATRWSAIRDKAAHTGKPQNVTVADAQRMADALGEELSYLMVMAKENARKQGNPGSKGGMK